MTMLPPVRFAGRYVLLEPLTHDHLDELAAAGAEDRSSYEFTWVPDGVDDANRYVDVAMAQSASGASMVFLQRRVSDGVVCGSTRFMNFESWTWAESNGLPDVVEIGSTWLSGSAQRTPINAEAKLLLMTHAFEVWRVQRLWIKTDACNARSRIAIERLGAQFEGVLRNHMPAYGRPGPRDTASYSVVPAEWPAIKAALVARLPFT